jgi:hypothetical protein
MHTALTGVIRKAKDLTKHYMVFISPTARLLGYGGPGGAIVRTSHIGHRTSQIIYFGLP